MEKFDIDAIVKDAAKKISDDQVRSARAEVEAHVEGRAWNMNQPLNMIAYEDQK